jgi:hypothetical protein
MRSRTAFHQQHSIPFRETGLCQPPAYGATVNRPKATLIRLCDAARVIRLSAVLVVALLSGCSDLCGNDSFLKFKSPLGTRKVVVFRRNCGATTAFSTQASLLTANADEPKSGGNILVLDDDHGKVPVGPSGRLEVSVTFADDSTVTLRYPARARVFTRISNRDGATIHFEPDGK